MYCPFPCQGSELWQHELSCEPPIILSSAHTLGLAQSSSLADSSQQGTHTHTQSAAPAQPAVESRTWNISIRMAEFWGAELHWKGSTNSWHAAFFSFHHRVCYQNVPEKAITGTLQCFWEHMYHWVSHWDYSLISCKANSHLAFHFQDFWEFGLVDLGDLYLFICLFVCFLFSLKNIHCSLNESLAELMQLSSK